MKDLFLLDPGVIFFNHGSFGACPRPVFEVYQDWQRQLEWEPIDFLGRRQEALIAQARARLAEYLHTQPDNLIFVTNATNGMNTVARSFLLDFQPDDELLTTDHEYGAINKMWDYISARTGLKIIRHPIPVPVTSHDDIIEPLWAQVTPRTRMLSLSHITSATALTFPLAELCRRARAAGIPTVVDGAHAPGQIDVDVEAIGADFYTGNCHKWMCAPKGSGFLYVRPEWHDRIDPLVISHGWGEGSTLISRCQWQGTRDTSAYLSVPAAIDFMAAHDWHGVRQRCHQMAIDFSQRMTEITGIPPYTPYSTDWFSQMITVPLPDCDQPELARRIYEDYRIVVPIYPWNGRNQIRVSFQAYNTQHDADTLIHALAELLPVLAR
jgi:isopenicillin-N epimerase